MTRDEFAIKIKAKYPAYSSLDNNALVDKFIAKYPVYKDQITETNIEKPAETTAGPLSLGPRKSLLQKETISAPIPGQSRQPTAKEQKELQKAKIDYNAPVGYENTPKETVTGTLKSLAENIVAPVINPIADLPANIYETATGKKVENKPSEAIASFLEPSSQGEYDVKRVMNTMQALAIPRALGPKGATTATSKIDDVVNAVPDVKAPIIPEAPKAKLPITKNMSIEEKLLNTDLSKIDNVFTPQNAVNTTDSKIKSLNQRLIENASDPKEVSNITNQIQKLEQKASKESTKVLKKSSPIVKEALDSGFDEPTVKFVSDLKTADKAKAQEMINIAEKLQTDKSFRGNTRDIVGKSIVDRVKVIENSKKVATKGMNDALESMAQNFNDISKSRNSFIDNLKKANVRIRPNGELSFGNSTIVDKGVQNIIKEAYAKTASGKLTPKAIRSLRSRIYALENKANSKVLDKAMRDQGINVLESFRTSLSGDINNPEYQKFAKQFAESNSVLEDLYKKLGKAGERFSTDEFKTMKAGEISSRMLSNASSDINSLMDTLDAISVKNGYKTGDSLYNQVVLANEIEKLYKVVPQRSLGGQVQNAVEGATAVGDIAKVASGDITKAPGLIEKAKAIFGKGEEAQKIALKKMLSQNTQTAFEIPEQTLKTYIDDIIKFKGDLDENQLIDLYQKSYSNKQIIDNKAGIIAQAVNGTPVIAPLKGPKRAIQKIMEDYNGDVYKIGDIARNTVAVEKKADFDNAIKVLTDEFAKDGINATVKKAEHAIDPLGYNGVNIKVSFKDGTKAEMQINTPDMIYAKEKWEDVVNMFGKDKAETLKATYGEGGKGHVYYEEWRNLDKHDVNNSSRIQELENTSKNYYTKFLK